MVPLHCVGGFILVQKHKEKAAPSWEYITISIGQDKEKFPVFIGIIYLGLSLVLE